MEKNILFINPNMYSHYKSKVKLAINPLPSLTMASLAAHLLAYNVKIIDMAIFPSYESLIKNLKKFNPDYICTTSLTPSFNESKKIIEISRQYTDAKVILGGPHTSSFPEKSLEESKADITIRGEGDLILKKIIKGTDLKKINGICYKKNKKIIRTPNQPHIQNLDILPFPAWHLLDIKKYKGSKLISKKDPIGPIETSRGCVYGCTYCNKNIFGRTFRIKTPKRVVEEIKFMLNLGFKEVYVYDDGFSTDMERGKKICRLISKEKLKFPWALANGIRIDKVDRELMNLLHKAGCYRVVYGIESGNQEVLNRIRKGIKLDQVRKAVNLAKKYNLEVQGFFMFGLPNDTEKTMKQTIDFAKSLDLDIYKASVTMPLPGTPLYNELNQLGSIKIKDWSLISQQSQKEIYKHPNLEWETIYKYYKRFYKETIYHPKYIFRRLKRGLFNGRIFWDGYYFLKSLRYDF